jgi:arylsulfatase A-like enzyme
MMNYLKIILLLLSLTSFCYAQKPNILWVTIEDTSPHFIGCYGDEHARTPVIDRLASAGVRFTNAFSTGTVCSPSRSTIITGVRTYEMGTGNHRSAYPIPEFIKGFPYYLQRQGYYVTNNSKTDYNVAREKDFIKEAWHENSNNAGWWDRQSGQPFFAIFNFNDSHQSRTMTHAYDWYEKEVLHKLPEADRIGENDFSMPPFYRDSPEMRRQFARVYNSIKLTDNKIGKLLDRLAKDNLMDSTIIFFYGDHGEGIPRGKTNAINLGYRVPFVIWFPPMYKHLSPWGTGTVSDELISFEDLAPTLISLAEGEVPAHMTGRVLLGKERHAPTGKLFLSSDRSDNGIDMVRTVTNGRYVYSRNYLPFMPEARYIRYMEIGEIKQIMRDDLAQGKLNPLQESLFKERPAEYLYDIENDLWETRNLVDDPHLQPLLREMRAAAKDNALTSRDVMFLPEYEFALISESTTLYQFRNDKKKYPLEEIYAAASLSGIRGKEIAKQQVKLLESSDKIIRFWAVAGLRSQSPEVLKRYSVSLMKAMQDPYPPVAITASAITYDIFGNKTAEANLKRYSHDVNADLALLAINYMLYVRNPQPFVETIIKLKDQKDLDYNVSAATKDFLGKLKLLPNNFEYR